MADPGTQIRAILEGRAYHLATAELGVSHMARHSYSEVFYAGLLVFTSTIGIRLFLGAA